jgi:hypothetical protein
MDEFRFEVQGSAPAPYRVTFIRREGHNLSAYCSCPAGENGQHCKHRLNILAGESKGIVSQNVNDVALVQAWLPGTDLEAAIEKMRNLEAEAARITKALSLAKKDVARAMRD